MAVYNRNGLIKAIHTAKRSLHLDDDNYRAVLMGAAGKDSCKDMDEKELAKTLKAMRKFGFGDKKNQSGEAKHNTVEYFRYSQYKLCYALWCELYEMGAVKNKNADALNSYFERMIPELKELKNISLCNQCEFNKVIESLKEWIARLGVDRAQIHYFNQAQNS